MTSPSRAGIRLDRSSVKLGATPIEIRPDGYRVYRGVAAFGDVVLEYPEEGRNEFVPAKVALSDEALRSTDGVPFTILHPDDLFNADDEDEIRARQVGTVLRPRANWDADPPELVVDVIVHSRSAQEAVESGRVADLSLGYRAKDERRPGVHRGKPYQVVQTSRLSNHLSGVLTARSTTPDGRRARLDEAGAPVRPAMLAGERRPDAVVLPPSRRAATRFDEAGPLEQVAAGHPATTAPAQPYDSDMPSWSGWSEASDGSWVAFWPRDPDAGGLLWERRSSTGAVLGRPLGLPACTDYARRDTRGRMLDDETIEAETPNTSKPRTDAEPGEGETEAVIVDDPAAMLVEAAVAAKIAPEDAEILKTLSPEGQALVLTALKQVRAEEAEQAVMAEPVAVEAEEVEDATPPMPAGGAVTMDQVQKMIADALAKQAAPAGPKKDAAAKLITGTPQAPARLKTPEGAIDVDAIDEQAARKVKDAAGRDAEFIGRARKDGHVQEGASLGEAAAAMLAVVRTSLPKLADAARDDLKNGRRDAFIRTYEQAEDIRRAGLLSDQESIFRDLAADDGAPPHIAAALSAFGRTPAA